MKVKLARSWFGPDGNLRKTGKIHEVPDSWKDQLPPKAEVIEEVVDAKPATKAEEKKLKSDDQKSLSL